MFILGLSEKTEAITEKNAIYLIEVLLIKSYSLQFHLSN
jgi:hypothetical protein